MPVPRLCALAAALLLGLLLLGLPPATEKPGSCPNVDLPQLGICQDQCQEDSQCPGLMKCCRNGCGKVSCVTPNF
uniref:WAP four-disulfide core domain 2 n=1 Tax=Sciurus vulgaris TaxID=55149 RepID=A0A8D2AJV4_SCIVU